MKILMLGCLSVSWNERSNPEQFHQKLKEMISKVLTMLNQGRMAKTVQLRLTSFE